MSPRPLETITIPPHEGALFLARTIRVAPWKATIEVHSEALLALAGTAAGPKRLDRPDLTFVLKEPTITIPTSDWPMALADAIATAPEGATIEVHDEGMLECAKSACEPDRLDRLDLKFVIREPIL